MRSEVGVGSTFGFAIPTGAVAEPPPAGEPASGESDAVLVVEDDRRSADLLSLYLQGAGYRVVVARDGAEGLRLARRIHPSAVLLDVLLPRLDGWEVLAALKTDPATAECPVLVVSMLDERGKGFALGAADYLVKPVGREELLEALARWLPQGGATRSVLVIDDDPVDRKLVEATLEPEGYQILTAPGGEEGIELARLHPPSVILLDLLMPHTDGFAVVERLRADPATVDVPIVVLTAKQMSAGDRERLSGQISFLARKGDFGRAELVELVGRLAHSPGAHTEELL
jgi:CheY-like chemotaxis protein